MKKLLSNTLFTFITLLTVITLKAQEPQDSIAKDSTVVLPYEFTTYQSGSLYLNDFDNYNVVYDVVQNQYMLVTKIGDYEISYPILMTAEEYSNYRLKRDMHEYYKGKTGAVNSKKKGNPEEQKNLLPKYYVNSDFFKSVFGSNEIEVNMQGNIEIKMGFLFQETDNPNISDVNRSPTIFDFNQNIGASIMAKVGERLNVSANYDTQSTFNFQDIVKLEFDPSMGYDDDGIIRKIEAGNVSMPIRNSLINGAQNLFGLRTELQFGKTTISTVFAKQQSQSKTVRAEGGSIIEEFEMQATDYDADRHFFLAHYFKDTFDEALIRFPLINSSIQITTIEVWVTNTNNTTNNVRSIVALADLGESQTDNIGNILIDPTPNPPNQTIPSNDNNELSEVMTETSFIRDIGKVNQSFVEAGIVPSPADMEQGSDYSVLQNARRLVEGVDFKLDRQLGFISLNRMLAESDVLAVAYEYTVNGSTEVYKVGELSSDGIIAPNNLVVKLLRGEMVITDIPLWDLMMKNIYNLQAYQLEEQGFRLEIMYKNDETGVPLNTLQAAKTPTINQRTLLNLFHLDRLDQNDQEVNDGDGYFDFVEGITIYAREGYMMFPKVKPFGDYIEGILTDPADEAFVFNELYNLTQSVVKNTFQQKDKYLIKGYYKTDSASGIALGAFNVPQGSVHVTSGGRELVEGVDYVVDYQIGRVKIINPSIEASNAPINVSVEQNAIFNQDRRSFFGVDVEHKFTDNFVAGASFLNIREKPFTNKVFFGSEPINNSVFGLNLNYNTEASILTKWVNKLPFSKTDAASNFSIRGDVAYLIPGTPKTIDINGQAASYIDDFDGSQIPLQIRSEEQWFLASTPRNSDLDLGGDDPNLGYGKKRARFSWYNVDYDLYSGSRPDNIGNEELSRAEVRRINYSELFPNDELDQTESTSVRPLNLAFFPNERGAYNYDTENLNTDGTFSDPEERWGGITRPLTITDFENSNIEYIQFWMLDPWTNYSITNAEGLPAGADPKNNIANQVGEFYINLGNISEDVLKDGSKAFENGLPDDGSDANTYPTFWGKIPTNPSLLNSFENDDTIRLNQDIGLDGMNDTQEKTPGSDFPELSSFIAAITNHAVLNQAAKNSILEDPASDNFHFYKGSDLDNQNATIISRYKNYGRTQGNAPTMSMSTENYPTASTQYPDTEDINKDQTMSTAESYFQYRISLNPNDLVVGEHYIVDRREEIISTLDGSSQTAVWYQVRIPISSGEAFGGINNFHSIRFMRMFMTGFNVPVVLRLGKMEMVRGEWRRYKFKLDDATSQLEGAELDNYESGVVNIEENEGRTPIPYRLPPGIERERLQGTTTIQEQNEQALTLKIRDLDEDDSRALFKNVNFDLRMFKRLQMFIHAESKADNNIIDDELVAIIRIGSDLSENFYQIEQPLKITAHGTSIARSIWPEANELNIDLDALKKLKLDRFEAAGQANELFPIVAESELPTYRIRVKGHPNLGNVKTIMLGVKNKSALQKTGEIWFNEMRVSEFDNEGGWAAIVSADANFADLLDVSVTGRMSTQGYGNVDQSINERSQENIKQYDAVSNLNAGKLFPNNWGLQIPLSVSYGEETKDPKYDAQYQDILLADTNDTNSEHRNDAQDYTKRTSISLINVKKNRNPNSKRKARFYNFENLAFSYAYNEVLHRDYNIEMLLDQNVRASVGYTYSFKPIAVTPFKNSKKLKGKYFKIIKDFNFNLLPNTIAINSNFLRDYNEQKSRVLVEGFSVLPTLKQRNFLFDWDYSIGYKLTKALRFNFRALNNNVYDSFESTDDIKLYDNFFDLGRPTHYHQTLDASYEIPIDKIPLFSFIKSNYSYTADFDWQGASKSYVEEIGNTVQNANTHNLSVDLNMKKFYKEIGLPKLLRTKKQWRTIKKNREKKRAAKKKEKEAKKAAKEIEERTKELAEAGKTETGETGLEETSKTEESKSNSEGESGQEGERGERGERGEKKGKDKSGSIANKVPKARSGKSRSSKTFGGKLFKGLYDIVTAVDKVRVSYQENNGTMLPAYKPSVGLLGRDSYSGGFAPSFGFVFGSQVDIRNKALENGWMLTRDINDVYYNKIYTNTHYDKLDITAKVSPFKHFDIDVSANKIYTRNISSQIDPVRDTPTATARYAPSVVSEMGNFSMSYFMLGTAFESSDVLFQQFKDNRDAISQRHAENTGYNIDGYGSTSQQVILPAFLAAYSGQSVDKVSLNPFRNVPLPNWQVRYRGLMKLKWFKKRFKSFSVSHAYRSSYSILNFANNLQYNVNTPTAVDLTGNYFNEKLYTNVGLIEEFSPLVKVEFKLKNSFSIEGRVNQDRMMTLNFNNNTMTQNTGTEYVVGLGYRLKDIPFTMRLKGKKMRFKGDLNMKVDVSLRKDKMMVRYFGEDDSLNDQVTGGQNLFNIRVIADYALTKNLQAGFYYLQDASVYEISTSYDRRSISSGISVKYNLGN